MLTGLVSFILLGLVIYFNVSNMMVAQSKNNAMGLAIIAANEIDGDSFDTIRSGRDDAYFDVLEKITKYTDYSMLQYIYTMRYKNEKLTFVVDADPKNPAACGEEYEFLPEMEPALHGQACCDSKLIKDKWGSFFSAYAPIFNSEHEVVGMVGCDIRTSDIVDRLTRLRNVMISLITIFAILSLISMVMIAHDMLQRDQLTEISNESRLNDVAAGYSSLSMLKNINVDVVKIDKSFFDSLGDKKQHGANLVGNVIRMIKDLDRIVICEGVETEEQVEFLKSTECNIVQGFLFDKPLPVEQFEERLKLPKY